MTLLKTRLAAPGPVEVPPQVLAAIGQAPLHHRTDAFAALLLEARKVLAALAALPDGDVAILSGSGTSAFEAAFLASVPKGAPVLAVSAGKFGERWAQLARSHGHEVHEVQAVWGDTPSAKRIAEMLDDLSKDQVEIAAVTLVHSETSTGVLHDVAAQAAAIRSVAPDARILVDAVTSLGVSELDPLGWGLDAIVAGSQKGVMLPPGLGFAWLSERVRAEPPAERRNFAGDLHAELPAQRDGRTGTTPAVGLIAGLAAAGPLLLGDGLTALLRRRARLNEALLAAGEAAGLTRFAVRPSPALAALRLPDGMSASEVVAGFATRGVRIAGGQNQLRSFLIRPSLLGWADEFDALGLAGTLEAVLRANGLKVPYGAATAAAAQVLEASGEGY